MQVGTMKHLPSIHVEKANGRTSSLPVCQYISLELIFTLDIYNFNFSSSPDMN